MAIVSVEKQVFDPDGDLDLILSYPFAEAEKTNEDAAILNGTEAYVLSVEADVNEDNTVAEEVGTSDEEQPESTVTMQTEAVKEEPKMVEDMMLSSPVFKAMLQHGTFKEGKALQTNGKAEIPLSDDDVEGWEIILNIIHGRSRKVPRQVNLLDMTEISILVDKYQMTEAVEVFSDSWIEDLKIDIPTELSQGGVFSWIGISWVFGKRVEFQKMTSLVLKQIHGDTLTATTIGLPIPNLICDTIEKDRNEAMFELYALIDQTIRRYQRAEILCGRTDHNNVACDAMLLGTLLKSATVDGLYPAPPSPYKEISFSKLVELARNLKVEALCDRLSRIQINGNHPEPMHGFKARVEDKIKELEERLSGLDIEKFKELKVRV